MKSHARREQAIRTWGLDESEIDIAALGIAEEGLDRRC